MFRITAFAELSGTSSNVLRDYHHIGLFHPVWIDPVTGYRMYSPAQLPQLRRILALRAMGVGLDDIGRLIRDGEDLGEVLGRRRAALEAVRREIDRRLAALGIELEASQGGDSTDVVVRELRPELVATLDIASVGDDVERAFYELERAVRDAGTRASRPPGMLSHRPAQQAAGRVEVFVPVRRAADRRYEPVGCPWVERRRSSIAGPTGRSAAPTRSCSRGSRPRDCNHSRRSA